MALDLAPTIVAHHDGTEVEIISDAVAGDADADIEVYRRMRRAALK